MAASGKEVKALLKSARTALDKKDYEDALKHCEAVLWSDPSNYLANVMAGKAHLLLGNIGEAKLRYKEAIAISESDILAWKGLVVLYDEHGHSGLEEDMLLCISAYQKILTTQVDDPRRLEITCKLAKLFRELKQNEQACLMYDSVLTLGPSLDVLKEGVVFLLNEGAYNADRWSLLKDSYFLLVEGVASDTKRELIVIFINSVMKWIKLLSEDYHVLLDHMKEYCPSLMKDDIDEVKRLSTETLCTIELWEYLKGWSDEYRPHPLNDYQRDLFMKGRDVSCSYEAVALLDNGKKIKESCQKAVQGVTDSPNVCEYHAMSCICHLMSHDYHMTINTAKEGLKYLSNAPLFLQVVFRKMFYIVMMEALVCSEQYEKALGMIEKELQDLSHDCHVTELHIRALLGSNRTDHAKKVLSSAKLLPAQTSLCKGLISVASKEYELAVTEFKHCIEATPTSPWYLYNLAVALMASPTGNKKEAYEYLIKAAQLDSLNPRVFLQLGHYQRHVTKDMKRAAKCYQKSFSSVYGPVAAGVSLGEVYTALKDEESAFKAYNEVIKKSLPSQCKEAWLRVGLYHRKCNRYEEAIKCFLTVLRHNSTDFHVWECIAEAYHMRGSHTSSLKAFTRAVEFNPQSLYCQYQIASIQQSLGQYSKAVEGYTAVLNINDTYVPALKGRAEVYYNLAHQALDMAFDGKAVDLVALALKDLARAVVCQPSFLCLWKLIGDCCVSLSPVAPGLIDLTVPVSLMSGNNGGDSTLDKPVNKEGLFNLAINCYGHALQLTASHTLSSSLLHNMSLAYKALSDLDTDNQLKHLSASLQLIKKGVSLLPGNGHYWNTLGVIASQPLLATPSLAQHAFIKSLTLEPNNAQVWTNLGSLYFMNGNIRLAHDAFTKAQACDPAHIEGWVGDGLVAEHEVVGKHEEAMNFFNISLELGYHPESAVGYAQWVCHTLSTSELDSILCPSRMALTDSAHQQVNQALDSLVKYVLRNPNDTCALNLLGLLYEQVGLVGPAEACIAKARELMDVGGACESPEYFMVLQNHARILSSKGEFQASLDVHKTLNERDSPRPSLDYALTLHRMGKFYEAAGVYEEAMNNCLASSKPYLLLASGMSLFGENIDDCKAKLFKVYQTPPPIVHGIISLAAFGGHSNDVTLLQATLNEIKKLLEIDPTSSKQLHPSCYRVLKFLIHLQNNSECLESLRLISSTLLLVYEDLKPPPIAQDVLQLIVSQSPDQSILTLQRFIHNFPDNLWVWSLLCYVLVVMGRLSEARTCLKVIVFKAEIQSKEISSCSKLLQLRTNELQTVRLLLAWCGQVTKAIKT